jgi:hypothetical protein
MIALLAAIHTNLRTCTQKIPPPKVNIEIQGWQTKSLSQSQKAAIT